MLRPLGLGEESLDSFAAEVAARSTHCDGGQQRGSRGRPGQCPRVLLVAVMDSLHRASYERLDHSSAVWEAHERMLHRTWSSPVATRAVPAGMSRLARRDARCGSSAILKSSRPRIRADRTAGQVGAFDGLSRGGACRYPPPSTGWPDWPSPARPVDACCRRASGGALPPPENSALGPARRRSVPNRRTAFLQAAVRRFSPRWAGRGRGHRRRSRPGCGRGLRSWPGPCRHAS